MAGSPWNRRAVLEGLGAAAVAPLLPGCGDPGDDPRRPPLEDFDLLRARIDTVVVVVMENRSFDHILGALSIEEGRDDVDGLRPEHVNPHPDGTDVAPFPATLACVDDPPHGWDASHAQFDGGACDGFVREHYARSPEQAEQVMAYWTRAGVPTAYALADHYTVCDRWFASVMTSTWPNRYYLHAATSRGLTSNLPPDGFDFPSIFTRAEEAGLGWADYYGNAPWALLVPGLSLQHPNLRTHDEFFAAAEAGELPQVCFVEPIYGWSDDHPPTHPLAGQVFLAQIYDALARSPHWERTLLVITYDEHGGFHDHVPPPTAPDELASEGFDQLGFRVPALVVGPWVREGHVSHVVYDHTSILAFLEHLFELEPMTARDAAADPLRDVFDWDRLAADRPRPPIALQPIEADESELFAPECVVTVRREGPPPATTRQEELEAWLDAQPVRSRHDRRHLSEQLAREMIARARARGLLRPR